MFKTVKQRYTPPRVIQETEVSLERNLLNGSVVENFNLGGVYTTSQEVEQVDFETDEFNFKWE